jgi:ubiquinone/menaquinone biosynthesis C-methylase UbiE
MYGEFQYGNFSYGRDREQYYPLLFDAVRRYEPGNQLFDIGCGAGFWTTAYLEQGVHKQDIHMVDLSNQCVAQILERGFNAMVGDVTQLKIDSNSSDITICNGVIHHTDDPFQAFSELVRITRPGGTIYLSVYNKYHPYFYLVHRAAAPIRYLYWNVSRSVFYVAFPPAAALLQLAYLAKTRRPVDLPTLKAKFMDEVMTPKAALFTKNDIQKYAEACGAEVETFEFFTGYTMIQALITVR